MEKLEKVIAGIEWCWLRDGVCQGCPYQGSAEDGGCGRNLEIDTLDVLRKQAEALNQAEAQIDRLLGELVEREPVIHAHWICDCEPYHICSNCRHKFSLFDRVPRCPNCGAHMDEEVADE